MAQRLFAMLDKTDEAAARLKALGFSDPKGALNNLRLLSKTPFGPHLDSIATEAASSPSPEGCLNNLETIAQNTPEETLLEFAGTQNIHPLITICGSSPFLSNILAKNPRYFRWLFLEGGLGEKKGTDAFSTELSELVRDTGTFVEMSRALRLYKQKEFLRIGARDLLGLSALEEVTAELSDLASASLDGAASFSLKNLKKVHGAPYHTGDPGARKEASFTVIGLGKLGGRELNFSSDIDILYIYSSDKGETEGVLGKEGSRISLHDFFTRVSASVTRLMSSPTEDGLVFRVDLDLRPEGKSGDMANSLRSIEIYYESWGQSWERAALIKARPVAGDRPLGEEFLSMIRPFVFRRYLDFTAIDEIKAMKEKIDVSLLRRNPDTVDVKLGQGGIREIEFFCQALQLIHGGKDTELRERATLTALERLLAKGLVREDGAKTLKEGYRFLRNLEHRIQIVEGRQTQAIPARPEELERLARMMGFRDDARKRAGEHFWEEYRKRTEAVHEVYRSLFYRSAEGVPENIPEDVLILLSPDITEVEAAPRLAGLGFKDPGTSYRDLCLLKAGPALRTGPKAAALLERLKPLFLHRASSSSDPDRVLSHFERFISSIGGRTAFYSLLVENPLVVVELAKIFGSSEFLSRDLVERPENLDLLLSKELSIPYKERGALLAEFLPETLDEKKGYEERLSAIRRLRNLEVFRVGVNDIRGALTPRQAALQISFLAEASLEAAYRIALFELEKRYGTPERKTPFAVIGMGRLGGRELVYGSDLDIIFLYLDTPADMEGHQGRTTGPKPISNHEFFVKLGQRIISVLTLRTKEGIVFNVDTRLRPSGSSGPLVVSRSAFLDYHRAKTPAWERQALLKARPAAGDTAFGSSVLEEMGTILFSKPLSREDVSEMLRIRGRMEAEIAREDETRFNIKTGKGALVDIEFLIQALQLLYGRDKRALRTPFTEKALRRLAKERLLPAEDYRVLKEAYTFYKLLEMRLRIVEDRPEGYLYKDPERIASLAKRAGFEGEDGPERLLDAYRELSRKIRAVYLKTLEGLPL